MIIVMKPQAAESSITAIKEYIEGSGLNAHLSQGTEVTIIGVVGDKSRLSTENLISFKDVDRIVPVTETYKLANKKFHPEPSVVQVGPTVIGPDNLTIMAGPCAVETQEQLMSIAHAVKAAGATILRGGAYSPGPPPTPSRALRKKACATCRKPKRKPGWQRFARW